MVCGGFNCSKNALIVLNITYIMVSFILIGVAAYGRVAAVVTSLTLVGSLIACGVFLLIIALIGLLGAAKHHQVLLFFYMIILFLLFLLQFALACACLAVNADQKDALAEHGWRLASNDTRKDVQRQFDCCGFEYSKLGENETLGHPPCKGVSKCCENSDAACCTGIASKGGVDHCPCDTCLAKMRAVIYSAFSATGGVGLFFSLTEVICDADLIFINVVAKWPGSVHDARMLRESRLFAAFESGHPPLDGVLLGDSGYMLWTWLMTPVSNPASAKERRYNYAHSSTRSTVERCIGVAKQRFQCLRVGLRLQPPKACQVIMACLMLHNRARCCNIPQPPESDSDCSSDDDAGDLDDDTGHHQNMSERAKLAAGKTARDRIINSF